MSKSFYKLVLYIVTVLTPITGINCAKKSESGAAVEFPSQSNLSATFNQNVRSEVLGLHYSEDLAEKLLQIANGWQCENWKQCLDRAKKDYEGEKIDAPQRAKIECEILDLLCGKITANFEPSRDPSYFELEKILTFRKATCMGFSELLYVLGRSLDLSINVIDVEEPVSGSIPDRHVACLVNLCNNECLMVDLSKAGFRSNPFNLMKECTEEEGLWILKDDTNPLKIHRQFRVWNHDCLVANLYCNRATLCVRTGNTNEAIKYHTKAIELDPRYFQHYYDRAMVYFILHKPDDSLSDFNKTIELDKRYVKAYYYRGLLFSTMEKYTEAIADFTKVIEIDPKNTKAHYRRGIAYKKVGEMPKAEVDFEEAKSLGYDEKKPAGSLK